MSDKSTACASSQRAALQVSRCRDAPAVTNASIACRAATLRLSLFGRVALVARLAARGPFVWRATAAAGFVGVGFCRRARLVVSLRAAVRRLVGGTRVAVDVGPIAGIDSIGRGVGICLRVGARLGVGRRRRPIELGFLAGAIDVDSARPWSPTRVGVVMLTVLVLRHLDGVGAFHMVDDAKLAIFRADDGSVGLNLICIYHSV